jgi:hypothetical protein
MPEHASKAGYLAAVFTPAVFGVMTLVASGGALVAAPCQGPGAPTNTQTKCLTAIIIPGKALRAYDISWANPDRAEYYLADRSNAGIDVINTDNNTFKRRVGALKFTGVVLNPVTGAPNNNLSGPDGVVTHGRWLYAGDGDSTLKVFDLNGAATTPNQTLSTGGTTRVDEMAITTDGELLLVANNAEDPPFGTLFAANGDDATSHVVKIIKITVDPTIIPTGAGLSIEQPSWDPKTQRFYVSVPTIADNPKGCTFGPPNTCSGGLLVIDPFHPTAVLGTFDPVTNTGVVALVECGPNGSAVGPNDNLLLGCTPGNEPSNNATQVINAKTKHFANIGGVTGSDEVWFNSGDKRYYTGSNANPGQAVLGVINAETNLLIETIPQGSASHSVAADNKRERIYVPQAAPFAAVGTGGDTTAVGAGICGTNNDATGTGCVAVYSHDVDDNEDEDDQDHGDGDGDHHHHDDGR